MGNPSDGIRIGTSLASALEAVKIKTLRSPNEHPHHQLAAGLVLGDPSDPNPPSTDAPKKSDRIFVE
jgi:hypothetical protein